MLEHTHTANVCVRVNAIDATVSSQPVQLPVRIAIIVLLIWWYVVYLWAALIASKRQKKRNEISPTCCSMFIHSGLVIFWFYSVQKFYKKPWIPRHVMLVFAYRLHSFYFSLHSLSLFFWGFCFVSIIFSSCTNFVSAFVVQFSFSFY